MQELLRLGNPFHLHSSGRDVPIAIVRAMSVKVAMIAIPLTNKPFQAVPEVADGALVQLLAFGVSEQVEGHFEFEVVLDHV